jgi:dolichyl-phosphate-mannose--protein O-mannosyl transferase
MPWPTIPVRRDLMLALALAAVAALFRLPGLGHPGQEVFDEVYHAKTALQYLYGGAPVEWVHPPTAKLLIAIGVGLFGYEAWAWRLMSALAGIALAPIFFLMARRILETERAALLASGLLLTDGVYLVQSRMAMTNIFAVLFQIAAALFVLRAARGPRLRGLDIIAAGVCVGLAISTRWTSLWAAAFVGLALLAFRGRRLFRPRELGLAAVSFGLIPPAIYLLSYLLVPVPAAWLGEHPGLVEILRLQKSIFDYHATLQADHPYFSHWYTWPWLYRPTWYHFEQGTATVQGIVALGNPAIWWASVPVTLWALVTGLRTREAARLFCSLGFVCLYLPWGLSPRTLNYNHYLFEAIPYACLSLGTLLDRHWEGRLRSLTRGYVALAVLLFAFFLPFLTAIPVPRRAYFYELLHGVRPWTWFSTWV